VREHIGGFGGQTCTGEQRRQTVMQVSPKPAALLGNSGQSLPAGLRELLVPTHAINLPRGLRYRMLQEKQVGVGVFLTRGSTTDANLTQQLPAVRQRQSHGRGGRAGLARRADWVKGQLARLSMTQRTRLLS
jgi:hypothetical protein